jgi:phosphatidylserine/phosphatidylglycerophosphate/cardiolipin synthase-like enzyme
VTEEAIRDAVLELLEGVGEGDEVRIQMFFLSFKPVVDAILEASLRAPVLLLLDANKDSFNREKDGTPNRQVARHLLKKAARKEGRLAVRWYSTHGEQNHAKAMSITNRKTGKYVLTTGSCNWTGRNMDGVNMEANVIVEGSERVVGAFNTYFDAFWSNKGAVEYSLPYEVFKDQTAADWKWTKGEKPFYYSTF